MTVTAVTSPCFSRPRLAEFLQLLADVLKQRGEEVDVLRENARLVSAPIRLGGSGKNATEKYGITRGIPLLMGTEKKEGYEPINHLLSD